MSKNSKRNKRLRASMVNHKEEQIKKFKELEQKRFDLEKERNINPGLLKSVAKIKAPKKTFNKNKTKRDKKKPKSVQRVLQTSKGELCIQNYLTQIKVKFRREVTFDDLFNPITNQPLRFDFYLAEYNLAIEFDGAQHFMYVKDFHGDDKEYGLKLLEAQQYRDKIKDNYCERNNMNFLRISYREINDVKKIIDKKLKEIRSDNQLVN